MKILSSFLSVMVAIASAQLASADTITSVVVSDGNIETTLSAGGPDYSPNGVDGADAFIQSFTSGGITYNTLVAADGFVGDAEGVRFQFMGSDPAPSVSDAVSDLNLATGALEPYENGTEEYFDFSSQTITDDTVFFLFNSQNATTDIALVNNAGVDITDAILRFDPNDGPDLGGTELELNELTFDQTVGGPAREPVAGNTFAVSEFTFNAGFSAADVAGFRGSNSLFDAQDAGIASVGVAIPEPSSAILLVGGLGAFLVRRRK